MITYRERAKGGCLALVAVLGPTVGSDSVFGCRRIVRIIQSQVIGGKSLPEDPGDCDCSRVDGGVRSAYAAIAVVGHRLP
jgi:hypothetical protein